MNLYRFILSLVIKAHNRRVVKRLHVDCENEESESRTSGGGSRLSFDLFDMFEGLNCCIVEVLVMIQRENINIPVTIESQREYY